MPIKRHFLGWDAPLAQKVPEFLISPNTSGPVDLANNLIVVPTRHAGRRLREALAIRCAQMGTSLLPPQVVPPTYFLSPDDEAATVANQTEVLSVWAHLLMHAKLNEYSSLFPSPTAEQDFHWAVHMGETIHKLRDTLADGGYRIVDVYKGFGNMLEELERWQDMARLETAYLETLQQFGKQDPIDLMIKHAENPEIPQEMERVIVAAVPDPSPLTVRALERLAEQMPIVVLIHAPESLADHFDSWGRPITAKWQDRRIDIPHPEEDVILAGTPASQSRKALEIASGNGRFGPSDIGIGIPDEEVTSFLAADLPDSGLPCFDPAGKTVSEHPLYQLLEAFQDLLSTGSFAAFSRFMHHADVLSFLQKKINISPSQLLTELDMFQNKHLPMEFEDIRNHLAQEYKEFPKLKEAFSFVEKYIFQSTETDATVRSLLQTIYESRTINPRNPEDREFTEVANKINAMLRELASDNIKALGMEKSHAMELLLERLKNERYYPDRGDSLIDLEGWLELPWDDAPFLIITGMNDGSVPDSRLSDVFLPDSLRALLNLRDDTSRLARDSYLMRELIESRREYGRVCFIAGKTTSKGDPLTPSRLLFHCGNEELVSRAEKLFGDPEERQGSYPPTVSFLLQPTPSIPPNWLNPEEMNVTQFRDYLQCPFRFYLKHILRMEPVSDEKTEMDALDFGQLIHQALRRMAESDIRHCKNAGKLCDFLYGEVDDWASRRFGPSPPLQIRMQLDTAKRRLSAAANVQCLMIQGGWEIVESEHTVSASINGMAVTGRIDRIDRHRDTGHLRILDYKTADKEIKPEDFHLCPPSKDMPEYARVSINGKERRWVDLQLPLYVLLLQESDEFQNQAELGFFNLPKSTDHTGVSTWEDFKEEHLRSAKACAEGVIQDIQNRRFWPPASKLIYDEFQNLFPADVPDCIDVEGFQAFMNGDKLWKGKGR